MKSWISKGSFFILGKKYVLRFLDVNRSSVEEIRKERNLVRRTVQRDLSKLVTLGLIKEIAKSKTNPTKYYELLRQSCDFYCDKLCAEQNSYRISIQLVKNQPEERLAAIS